MALVGVLVIPDLAALGARILDATWAGPEFIGVRGLALVLAASGLAALLLRTQGSLDRSRLRKVASQVLRAVFTLAVVVIFTVPPLLLISWQSTHEDGRHIVEWSVAASAAVLAFCGLFVHANQTSLHSTYARRLARAYLVRAGSGASPPVRLADVGLDDLSWEGPQLLVCAAVNVGAGESAQGEGCTSFVFSHDYCGFPTRPANFVDGLAGKPLVDLVAASGAAIAPNMGRFTRESARALLALLNLRLGLWIRVPGDRQGGPATAHLTAARVPRRPLARARAVVDLARGLRSRLPGLRRVVRLRRRALGQLGHHRADAATLPDDLRRGTQRWTTPASRTCSARCPWPAPSSASRSWPTSRSWTRVNRSSGCGSPIPSRRTAPTRRPGTS